MCVALPGRITALEGNTALVDFNGNLLRAAAGLVPVAVGDWVLVHAGCILQKVSSSEAEEMTEIFREVEALGI